MRIAVDIGSREHPARWSYQLHVRNHPQRHVPIIAGERVCENGRAILERPDEKDREDAERLTQTHLEQVSENQKFRVLARFFESVRYLHIVPHVVREFRRDGVCGGTLRVIACIATPEVIEGILTHLAAREAGGINHPRAPPLRASAAELPASPSLTPP